MKTNRMLIFCLLLLALSSCKNKKPDSTQNQETKTETLPQKDIAEIKQHLEDQKRINTDEDAFQNPYTVTEKDLELAALVILEGLKNNGFKALTEAEFNNKIKEVFHIENLKSSTYKIHAANSYITLFGKQQLDYKELIKNEFGSFVYTSNLYLIKNQHILTELEYLEDLIEVKQDNSYKITISPYIIHRNKYLFNNDHVSLSWLLNNDQFFLSKLLTDFGYDKEQKINEMVLDSVYKEHTSKNTIRGQFIGSLFFVKDANNKLQIREGLLKYVAEHTTATDNHFLHALGGYVMTLIDGDKNNAFNEDPSKKFTALEKAKIIAYVANVENPAIDKFKSHDRLQLVDSPEIWTSWSSTLYNISVSNPEIIKLIEQNNYFGLPNMKGIIAKLGEEAPPTTAHPD